MNTQALLDAAADAEQLRIVARSFYATAVDPVACAGQAGAVAAECMRDGLRHSAMAGAMAATAFAFSACPGLSR